MRKIYLLLIIALAPLIAALAQPTVAIGESTACTGENFCVPVTTRDFTNINSLRFSINYDATVLSFTGAQTFNAGMTGGNGNLGAALFTEATPGEIAFDTWEVGDCSNSGNIGVTLPDDEQLFELCFDVTGGYGDQTTIDITSNPAAIRCTRNATLCNNIGIIRQNGQATICLREFQINAPPSITGNPGEQVCVNYTVTGFDALTAIQFSINYDSNFLEFVSLSPNGEIPNNNIAGYGLPTDIAEGPGNITASWATPNDMTNGVTIADGTSFFTVCYNILGECEQNSTIMFSDSPTRIEVGNGDPLNPEPDTLAIPVSLQSTLVNTSDCNPTGIRLTIDCGDPVNIGDQICVNVLAGDNFQLVREMQYLMTWNPNILEYVEANDLPGGGNAGIDCGNNLVSLSANDFDASNATNGILGLMWEKGPLPDQNLGEGDCIYYVCFNVIGAGADSPIQIISEDAVGIVGPGGGTNIGINPTNCVVEVIQPESPQIDFGDISFPLGESGCLPITVSNFDDVLQMQFTVNWDQNLFLFTNETNIAAGISNNGNVVVTPFGLSSATVDIQLDSPVSLADGATLMELCYSTAPTAVPDTCTTVTTVGLPLGENVVTASSGGSNIGLLVTSGDMCVLFPEGFGMTAQSTTGGFKDTVCMEFTVNSFDNILNADFVLNWDVTQLSYISSTVLNWPGLTLNAPNPVGTINGAFSSPTPVVIPEDEVVFEVCYQLIGNPNDCYGVSIQTDPAPTVETTNGPGSIVAVNGEICVEDQIAFESLTITPESCPGSSDGAISLTLCQWNPLDTLGSTWETVLGPTFRRAVDGVIEIDDLPAGEVVYTIFSVETGVFRTDTLNITVAGAPPTAEINGEDVRSLACSGPLLVTTPDQDGFSLNWYYNSVLSEPVGNVPAITVTNPGELILEVIEDLSGCAGYDTITILAPELPEAIIETSLTGFTCLTASATLNGTNSTGDNLVYNWTTAPGTDPSLITTSPTAPTIDIAGPGTYILQVTNNVTGCTNDPFDDQFDQITITDDGITPVACISSPGIDNNGNVEQNCGDEGTPLNGACSEVTGLAVSFAWFSVSEDGTTFTDAGGGGGLEISPTELGTYALVVTEQSTGCADTTFAQIVPTVSAPQVTIDPTVSYTCNTDSIQLVVNVEPSSFNQVVEWSLVGDDARLRPGTENSTLAVAEGPGTYFLVVTDPETACSGTASVTIEDQTTSPTTDIAQGEEAFINCANSSLDLDATGSQMGATFQWFRTDTFPDSLILINGATDGILTVTNPDLYVVEVTNPATGCTALDSILVDTTFNTPVIIVDSEDLTPEITCDQEVITINVNVVGDMDVDISPWVITPPSPEAVIVDQMTEQIQIGGAGTYTLIATDESSQCFAQLDIVATDTRDLPTINVLADTLTISCLEETVTLSGVGSAEGQNIVYEWQYASGNGMADDPTAIQTTTSDPGTYRFVVTDTLTGCMSQTPVFVRADTLAPILFIPTVPAFGCGEASREITVETIPPDDPYGYTWSAGTTPDNTPTVTVTQAGTYSVTVLNQSNGCIDSTSVVIGSEGNPPTIIFDPPAAFDCTTDTVAISAASTGDPTSFSTIEWMGPGIINGQGTFDITVDMPGMYTLTVVDAQSSCTSTDSVEVLLADPLTLLEIPDPNQPILNFNCTGDPVVIDLSNLGDPANFTVMWDGMGNSFTVSDTNQLVILAESAGDYTLIVNPSDLIPGCEVSQTFTVGADEDTPVAQLAGDVVLPCGDASTLDATGSTPLGGAFTYLWEAIDGSPELTENIDTQMPTVSAEGCYRLIVTNTDNGCADTSQVVCVTIGGADYGLEISSGFELTCGGTGTLMATATVQVEPPLEVQWLLNGELTNTPGLTGLNPTISVPGDYQVIIVDTNNPSCADTSAVATVTQAPADYGVNGGDGLMLPCGSEGMLMGSASVAVEAPLEAVWLLNGMLTEPLITGLTPTVSVAGDYQLIVQDVMSSCADTSEIVSVVLDAPDFGADAGMDLNLACGESGTLMGTASVAVEPPLEACWLLDGVPVPGLTTLTPEVSAAGMWQLVIKQTEFNCADTSDAVVVTVAEADFGADPGMDINLACGEEANLMGSASVEIVAPLVAQWVDADNMPFGPPGLTPPATTAGMFRLVVGNITSGCIDSTDFITVTIEESADFGVDPGTDLDLDCGETATLMGMTTVDITPDIEITWQDADGTVVYNGLTPEATASGMVRLIITNTATNCADTSAFITITIDETADFGADSGADVEVVCGEPAALQGSASVAISGSIVANWITSGPVIDDGLTPTVTEAGTYQLIVRDTMTGCADTAALAATVTLGLPELANAGPDQVVCGDEADLSGNAVAGVTGVWTTMSGAIIDMADNPLTMVSGLPGGVNSFIWTLSGDGCPDYSSDTVTINAASTPVADDDVLELEADATSGQINLVLNDELNGGVGFNLTVLTPPAFGSFDTTAIASGNLLYTVSVNEFGTTSLVYEFCNASCPDLCDTATVNITVPQNSDIMTPNGFTPNDDGLNDRLVFDIINNPDEEYPDNSIIIFNRWGDIIYEAEPYNNDWDGTNDQGNPVPEGTYYYILTLNIGEGNILRGDVTIIR